MGNVIKIENYLKGLGTNLFDKIPKEVLQFWSENYGKDVHINIIDYNGKSWTVDKVLTVDDFSDVNDEKKSWRSNSSPEELDYSLQYLESILPNWEEQSELIPIFGINAKDNSEYDLVVLNMIDKPVFKKIHNIYRNSSFSVVKIVSKTFYLFN